LSQFVGPASGDVTDGMADMDIGDEDDSPETQRMKGLKYISQLVRHVRVSYVLLFTVCLNFQYSNASRTVTNRCLLLTWRTSSRSYIYICIRIYICVYGEVEYKYL
jgi:hypothetical protein